MRSTSYMFRRMLFPALSIAFSDFLGYTHTSPVQSYSEWNDGRSGNDSGKHSNWSPHNIASRSSTSLQWPANLGKSLVELAPTDQSWLHNHVLYQIEGSFKRLSPWSGLECAVSRDSTSAVCPHACMMPLILRFNWRFFWSTTMDLPRVEEVTLANLLTTCHLFRGRYPVYPW